MRVVWPLITLTAVKKDVPPRVVRKIEKEGLRIRDCNVIGYDVNPKYGYIHYGNRLPLNNQTEANVEKLEYLLDKCRYAPPRFPRLLPPKKRFAT